MGKSSWRSWQALGQGGLVMAIALLGLWTATPRALSADAFPPSPLEVDPSDPLLPRLVVDRPLSPQERRVLMASINELDRQAESKFQDGDVPGAFDIWFRELRLRRVLGPEEEVPALSRIGEVAWRESQTTEVRLITQRLYEIEQAEQAQQPPNYDLLLQIAQAYQKVRSHDYAVALYEQLLTKARQDGDVQRQTQILTALGELHLAWFEYPEAADTYQQLLTLAQSQNNQQLQIEYLKKLADIYDQNNQPEQAIATRQTLVSIFEQLQQYTEIPALKLAIANAYVTLNLPDLAAPSYQEAYSVARSVQYYGYASDALQRLAELYKSLNRPDDALVVYQLLIDVEQQSYDRLGQMNAYDWIGQIYRDRGANNQALAAFRQGLAIARQLNYKVSYFNEQIQAISTQ